MDGINTGGSMKRLVLLGLMVLGIMSLAYADNIGTESIFNNVYNTTTKTLNTATGIKKGTLTYHRANIVTSDVTPPALGSGMDLTGYSKALVFVSADSTSMAAAPSWVITPLYGDSTLQRYFYGSPTTVVSKDTLVIDVYGEDDFYVLISNGNFAAGEICRVWVQGVN